MIPLTAAAELLGRLVVIADAELQRSNVELVGLRAHPGSSLDYLVDVDSGHCFTGSALTVLRQATAEDVPHVIPGPDAEDPS